MRSSYLILDKEVTTSLLTAYYILIVIKVPKVGLYKKQQTQLKLTYNSPLGCVKEDFKKKSASTKGSSTSYRKKCIGMASVLKGTKPTDESLPVVRLADLGNF